MSEPKEWFVCGYGVYDAKGVPVHVGNEMLKVTPVNDHDRIYRPEDDDYRLPTKEDGDATTVVLYWETNTTEGISFWCEKSWSCVSDNETWRRMPRGPGE